MGVPTVFISYSHKDKRWKDRLVDQLKVLSVGKFEIWHDHRIGAGDTWLLEIEKAIERAQVAVLLISPEFLTSNFICDKEVPRLLERRKTGGLCLIPVIVHPCAWEKVGWLAQLQCRPEGGWALTKRRKAQADQVLADLAVEIQDLLRDSAPVPSTPPLQGTSSPLIDLGGLIRVLHFVGREKELAQLDADWDDPSLNVLNLVGFWGLGKSALVGRWLGQMAQGGWRGAERVLAWSFDDQGLGDRVTSAELFLDHSLRRLGDPAPEAGSPRDRGFRLAELVRQQRTLLVLDGVETLQHPPGPHEGRLADPGLTALLGGLAAANPGLCLVITQEPVADLPFLSQTARTRELQSLDTESGIELLRNLGVRGRGAELRATVEELSGHALTLTLLGNYIRKAHGGDVLKRSEVELGKVDERQGGHAFQMIDAYVRSLGQKPELLILRLLGLFDGPADAGSLIALRRAESPIPGLTDGLAGLSDEDWRWAVSGLRENGLLTAADPRSPEGLDAHPLIRAYFAAELKDRMPDAWRKGNLCIYEYLKSPSVAPDLPETLEAMQPLYAAVVHGCRAGYHREAWEEVFQRRIQRGPEVFSTRRLGAFGSELRALRGFFDRPWNQPIPAFTGEQRSLLLSTVGSRLRGLGRLREACSPIQAALDSELERGSWERAAVRSTLLAELSLALGEISRAEAFARQGIELADRGDRADLRAARRMMLAYILHQAGRRDDSAAIFCEAKSLAEQAGTTVPLYYLLRYSEFVLDCAEPDDGSGLDGLASPSDASLRFRSVCQEILSQTMPQVDRPEFAAMPPLEQASLELTLGWAHLGLAAASPGTEVDFERAAVRLDRAMHLLRQARVEEFVVTGLLACASLRRFRSDFAGASADLAEAMEIAEFSSMCLHESDICLEWARLCRNQEDPEAARGYVARARKLVVDIGYGRRERNVAYLERVLGS